MAVKKGLGTGLEALFSNLENINAFSNQVAVREGIEEMDLHKITPNPNQPRKQFDENALRELSLSITEHGVIQPLIVSPLGEKFVIVAGERRYRASIIAGLKKIPVIVKNFNEQEQKQIALIENLQREDLNPIEEAYALKSLLEEYKMTQESLAVSLGKSRPAITNALRLLMLDEEVINLVKDGRLSQGHARCLVALKDKDVQVRYAVAAADKRLSVRQLEYMVNTYLNPNKKLATPKIPLTAELKELVHDMQRVFATKVKAIGTEDKGRISIEYYTKDDLQRIYEL
ncbi:MAG: ParB/RepB/Spo0J family partition protein, partial [Clostridia bacterium]